MRGDEEDHVAAALYVYPKRPLPSNADRARRAAARAARHAASVAEGVASVTPYTHQIVDADGRVVATVGSLKPVRLRSDPQVHVRLLDWARRHLDAPPLTRLRLSDDAVSSSAVTMAWWQVGQDDPHARW